MKNLEVPLDTAEAAAAASPLDDVAASHCGLKRYPPTLVTMANISKNALSCGGQLNGRLAANAISCMWFSAIFCNGCARWLCGESSSSSAAFKNAYSMRHRPTIATHTMTMRTTGAGQA